MIYDNIYCIFKLFLFCFAADYKRVEGAWLIDCGFVDVLCIRIASMKTAEVARRFVECLFSFIKTFSEIQATETVKVSYLASLILKDEDGVVSYYKIRNHLNIVHINEESSEQ